MQCSSTDELRGNGERVVEDGIEKAAVFSLVGGELCL